jgi:hypothetical protein
MKSTLSRLTEKSGEHGEFIAGFSVRLERLEYLVEGMDTGETVTEPPTEKIQSGASEHGL